MNAIYNMKNVKRLISIAIILVFIYLTFRFFDGKEIAEGIRALAKHPFMLAGIMALYLLSFCLKAVAWKLYLKGRPRFFTCLLGILYSLFVNHLLPVKAGDLVRVGVLSRRDRDITVEEAFHSVVVLRVLDMACLGMTACLGLVIFHVDFQFPLLLITVMAIAALLGYFLLKKKFPHYAKRQIALFRSAFTGWNGLIILLLTLLSWIMEAGVLYGTVHMVKGSLSFGEAAFVNSLTVAGQVFQVTPGGIANYESVMAFGLEIMGIGLKQGYTIALLTHGIKFIFSYAAGLAALCFYPVSFKSFKNWTTMKGAGRT